LSALTTSEAKNMLWQDGIISWKLHLAQKKIYKTIRSLDDSIREVLVFCARRFGKSYLGCTMAIEDCLQNPNAQVFIIAPTIKQASNICQFLIREIAKDAPEGTIKQTRSTHRWSFRNGAQLILAGFDTALEAMRGADSYRVYIEETGLATKDKDEYEYMLYSVIFPTLMHSSGKVIHLTSPSKIVDHPLHTITLPKCRSTDAYFEFSIEDNPLLTPEQIEQEIELLGGRDSVAVQRELFVKIVRDESITAVPAFNEEFHVYDSEPSKYLKYLITGDFGGSVDLHVFHRIAYDHDLGKVLVVEEKWFPNMTPTSVIKESLEEWDTYTTTRVIDCPSQTQIDLSSLGYATALPKKDKFDATVLFIRDAFHRDSVLVHSGCKLLIETLRSGTLNKRKSDWERTASLGHCDAIMSLVYGLRSVDKATDFRPKPKRSEVFTIEYRDPIESELEKLKGF